MRDVAVDVLLPRTGALQAEALGVVARPTMHLGIGDFGMKLHADGCRPIKEGLVGKGARRGRQQTRSMRQLEAFLVPLVNMIGEWSERFAGIGGAERIVADLDLIVGMELDLATEIGGQHLGT